MRSGDRPMVVPFAEIDPADVARFGGKGAGLAEMTRLDLPIPPGFVISTEVCRSFLTERALPESVQSQIQARLAEVERSLGRRFGDPEAPLLVSVRSGAPASMPGMMDTILNLGLCDATVAGLARMAGDERFAWDCYGRLLRSYGTSVRLLAGSLFDAGAAGRDGDASALRSLTRTFLERIAEGSGAAFPQDPYDQLREAIGAVFASSESPRARRYRKYAGLADDLGTAVVVQAMVFGNLDESSGTGVAFTRDPATGASRKYGEFLTRAQGEDVVGGEHDVGSLEECRRIAPRAWVDLDLALRHIERRRRDMCELEFTIEHGRLWILQYRVGQRTGAAAIRIALDLVDEGILSPTEAAQRIPPSALARLRDRVFDPKAPRELLGRGLGASPGAASGRIALSAAVAEEIAAEGTDAILVRPFTSPDDVAGMIAACGVVTARGGRTSHAAVVARGMDRPAVCGVRGLVIEAGTARFDAVELREGEEISIDGAFGEVYRGRLPMVVAPVDRRVERILAVCDAHRRLPLLCEQGPASWADGLFEHEVVPCTSVEELERVEEGGQEVLLIQPGESSEPQALIRRALDRTTGNRVKLFLRVDASWPASLPRLPGDGWSGIVATERGSLVARRLASSQG